MERILLKKESLKLTLFCPLTKTANGEICVGAANPGSSVQEFNLNLLFTCLT